MKPGTIALILLGVFLFCGAFCGLGYTVLNGSGPPSRIVNLFSDGDRLYVAYSSSKNEHDVVRGTGSSIKADLYIIPEHDSDNILTITDGSKKIVKQDPYLGNVFWSAKHQAVFFLRSFGAGSPSQPAEQAIWTWTRAKGSELWYSVFATHNVTAGSEMSESLDGKWFCFRAYVGSGDYTRYIYLVNWNTKQETWFATDMENGTDEGEFFMIDENTFFKCGSEQLGIRTKVFDKLTGKSRDSTIDGELEQFVEFQGEPWALRCRKGNYDVVKVSRQLDQVIQSIQIPTKL